MSYAVCGCRSNYVPRRRRRGRRTPLNLSQCRETVFGRSLHEPTHRDRPERRPESSAGHGVHALLRPFLHPYERGHPPRVGHPASPRDRLLSQPLRFACLRPAFHALRVRTPEIASFRDASPARWHQRRLHDLVFRRRQPGALGQGGGAQLHGAFVRHRSGGGHPGRGHSRAARRRPGDRLHRHPDHPSPRSGRDGHGRHPRRRLVAGFRVGADRDQVPFAHRIEHDHRHLRRARRHAGHLLDSPSGVGGPRPGASWPGWR